MYQLINTQTLTLCTISPETPIVRRNKLPSNATTPPNTKWVEDLPRPTDAPDEGKKWVKDVTIDFYGWKQEDVVVSNYIAPVTRRQLHLALLTLDTPITPTMIESMIDAEPDPITKLGAQIEYGMATSYERDNSLVASLGAALGLSEEDIDNLFQLASTL